MLFESCAMRVLCVTNRPSRITTSKSVGLVHIQTFDPDVPPDARTSPFFSVTVSNYRKSPRLNLRFRLSYPSLNVLHFSFESLSSFKVAAALRVLPHDLGKQRSVRSFPCMRTVNSSLSTYVFARAATSPQDQDQKRKRMLAAPSACCISSSKTNESVVNLVNSENPVERRTCGKPAQSDDR